MKLRDVEFGPVWAASGVQGFFGEGYWFHHWYDKLVPGFTFDGATFVAKTSPLEARAGKMKLDKHFRPKAFFPSCIKVNWLAGTMCNKVDLSSPGFKVLLAQGLWQQLTKPFQLSYMPVAETADKRILETKGLVNLLKAELPRFQARIGLQYNALCPNTGHNPRLMLREIPAHLDILNELGIPIIVKINVLVPIKVAREIAKHPACDALLVSNTIPFGELPDHIDWELLFPKGSPFPQFGGGGGLSGEPLFSLVREWVWRANQRHDFPKPIIACGGIDRPSRVEMIQRAGASGISFATVASLRPWRLKSIINTALILWKE